MIKVEHKSIPLFAPAGPDEPETGSGHRDRHLQEAPGGGGRQVGL